MEKQTQQQKIFDEYQVECNDCTHYWTDACDGVKKGSTRLCNQFLATRSVNIPEQIKSLEKRVDALNFACIGLCLVWLIELFGRWFT